jgi:hypothetical protein
MGALGKPRRKVEYWPLQTPVPDRRFTPNEPNFPKKISTPAREPIPTQR